MKFCKHVSYDEQEEKYLVIEPAVVEPNADYTWFKCSVCRKSFPIMVRGNGRVRIKLIPKGA